MMGKEGRLVQDDTVEFECRDMPAPVISDDLDQRMDEIAEAILFDSPTGTKAA